MNYCLFFAKDDAQKEIKKTITIAFYRIDSTLLVTSFLRKVCSTYQVGIPIIIIQSSDISIIDFHAFVA